MNDELKTWVNVYKERVHKLRLGLGLVFSYLAHVATTPADLSHCYCYHPRPCHCHWYPSQMKRELRMEPGTGVIPRSRKRKR